MKGLKITLIIHAIVTFMAAIVLIVAPTLIPKTVDITLNHDQYLLSYFLGAAELGIAYLSFQCKTITDKFALKTIIYSFIIFHAATGLLEIYGLTAQELTSKIIGNIILRIVIVALLFYFWLNKIDRQKA